MIQLTSEEMVIGAAVLSYYEKHGSFLEKEVAFVVNNYGISGIAEATGISEREAVDRILGESSFADVAERLHKEAIRIAKQLKLANELDKGIDYE